MRVDVVGLTSEAALGDARLDLGVHDGMVLSEDALDLGRGAFDVLVHLAHAGSMVA